MNIRRLLADKDEKNLLINVLMAFLVKGLALLISFFSMPQYIKYFNNDEVLGLWYTILSLLSWVLICDLGLGNGLRNRLTEALSLGNTVQAKKFVSSTYAALVVVILPVLVIGGIVISLVDLNTFFNISPDIISRKTLTISTLILFSGICISFVLKTVNVVIYAIQKSSVNNMLSLITSVIPLLYITVFKGADVEKNLLSLTIVHIIAINLPLLVASFFVFKQDNLQQCMPSLKSVDFQTATSMLGFGVQFFLAHVFFMFLTSTNEIMITRIFSAADVVEYSIYNKLFTMLGSLVMLALTPLWSKVTKDLAEKKYQKILKTNRTLYVISALAFVAELALVAVLQFVINLWLKDEAITVTYSTAFIFAFYGSMYVFNIVLTTVANGIGELKTQIVFYGLGSLLKIPVVYWLGKLTGNWNIVVLYGGAALLVFCLFQLCWLEKRLKTLSKNNNQISN